MLSSDAQNPTTMIKYAGVLAVLALAGEVDALVLTSVAKTRSPVATRNFGAPRKFSRCSVTLCVDEPAADEAASSEPAAAPDPRTDPTGRKGMTKEESAKKSLFDPTTTIATVTIPAPPIVLVIGVSVGFVAFVELVKLLDGAVNGG